MGVAFLRHHGDPSGQALVRPVTVELALVLPQHAPQMALTQDQDVVEAFPPHAPEEALAEGVLPWRTIGRAQLDDAS
jgi:hypothetical protein